MTLYRAFPWDPRADPSNRGGALFIARDLQASTRHGIPDRDGVLYASQSAVSAIAERIKAFRGRMITTADLQVRGWPTAVAALSLPDSLPLVDLTRAETLARLGVQPFEVATHDYNVTQRLSLRLFDEGAAGFLWWSALEAQWVNATLFASRTLSRLRIESVTALDIRQPDVASAAAHLGVGLRFPRGART